MGMGVVTALDGLRGLAVIGVLLFHTGHLPGGFLGVDLFFVLSGYLITGQLLHQARGSLLAFWGRRIRRLVPALAVMTAVVCLLVWAAGSPDLLRTTLDDGPWVQASLVNWHLLAESAGYWDEFGEPRIFEHLWSVAVEEQFYLVWPVVVLLVAGRRLWQVAAAGALASLLVMMMLLDPADPSRVYTGTDTRAFSLLLGALAATAPVGKLLDRLGSRAANVTAAVLVAGLAVSWLVADGTGSMWLFTGGLFVHALASATLIALCARDQRLLVARALSWRPLRWAGLLSYSLYLWHWPVIVLLSPERTGLDGWAWTAVVVAMSTGTAVGSKYVVEDPIRYRARWAQGRTGLAVFAVVMTTLAGLWLLVPSPAPVTIDVTDLG